MDKHRRMTYARLTEILRRQDPPQFGPAYEPAIRATREEAPSNCRPSFVWSSLLRREVSTLSIPEKEVLAIALYCPWLIDLQEQRMLPFVPSPHPLSGHPLAAGQTLPEFKGTLEVANRLNYLRYHPTVHRPKQDPAEAGEVPGCFIGDFLLCLLDRVGPFCVNLNVKSTRAEFTVPQVGVTVKTDMVRASAAERARHEIERHLYDDVGIKTIEVAGDELPKILVANLLQLSLWQKRRHTLTQEEVETVTEAFNRGLDSRASALDVITATELSHRIGPYEQKTVLFQGIFSRRIRPDLFDCHFFIDRPMRPESQDALEVFAAWFRRST